MTEDDGRGERGGEGRGIFRTIGTGAGGERKQDTDKETGGAGAEGSVCLGCVPVRPVRWAVGGRARAAPPRSPPVFQESRGREERKLTGDSAIPVIPDEIAARALACQEVGAKRPGRGRGWPEKSLADSFPVPSCLSPGDLDAAVGRVILGLGWRKDSSAQ